MTIASCDIPTLKDAISTSLLQDAIPEEIISVSSDFKTACNCYHTSTSIAELIAQYATSRETLVTSEMIKYFQKATPAHHIQYMKRTKLYIIASYLEDGSQKTSSDSGLQRTPEKKLMAWAHAYFSYVRGESTPNFEGYYSFLGRIMNCTIIRKDTSDYNREVCLDLALGHHKWYHRTTEMQNILLDQPEKVASFLKSKNYTIATAPAANQLVIYHTKENVHHYGIVDSTSEGEIMIRSKFGGWHVYLHRLELVPFCYGDQVTFFDPPKE